METIGYLVRGIVMRVAVAHVSQNPAYPLLWIQLVGQPRAAALMKKLKTVFLVASPPAHAVVETTNPPDGATTALLKSSAIGPEG